MNVSCLNGANSRNLSHTVQQQNALGKHKKGFLCIAFSYGVDSIYRSRPRLKNSVLSGLDELFPMT
jgi:hypothetical protein